MLSHMLPCLFICDLVTHGYAYVRLFLRHMCAYMNVRVVGYIDKYAHFHYV